MFDLAKSELRAFLYLLRRRSLVSPKTESDIVKSFHNLYYYSHMFEETWRNTRWLGAKVRETPMDLIIYQEIIYETKPDLIIQTGVADGGGCLFFASILDAIGKGEVVGVDIKLRPGLPKHPRISYLEGSSVSTKVVSRLNKIVSSKRKIMVSLDSDHSQKHVAKELKIYSPLVSKGCYLVVEDTNLNGHPVDPFFGPGPWEAVQDFLKTSKRFEVDKSRERLYLTFYPSGYLKRIK